MVQKVKGPMKQCSDKQDHYLNTFKGILIIEIQKHVHDPEVSAIIHNLCQQYRLKRQGLYEDYDDCAIKEHYNEANALFK